MSETNTTIVMIAIFCFIGVALPVVIMLRDKTHNSPVPNKLILWITMVFCMVLLFGIVVDFRSLDDVIREDIVQYGFISLMLLSVIFGVEQLIRTGKLKSVKFGDLEIEAAKSSSVLPQKSKEKPDSKSLPDDVFDSSLRGNHEEVSNK